MLEGSVGGRKEADGAGEEEDVAADVEEVVVEPRVEVFGGEGGFAEEGDEGGGGSGW